MEACRLLCVGSPSKQPIPSSDTSVQAKVPSWNNCRVQGLSDEPKSWSGLAVSLARFKSNGLIDTGRPAYCHTQPRHGTCVLTWKAWISNTSHIQVDQSLCTLRNCKR
eukprot:3099833-Amphidinium_carterae.1